MAEGSSKAGAGSPVAKPSMEKLVADHAGTLYRFAIRLVRQSADAEDLVQEAFIDAQRSLHQLREVDRPLPWLIQILRSRLAKRARQTTGMTLVDGAELAELAVSYGTDAESETEPLLRELDQLPAEFKEPLLLFYFRELRYREIASALELPIGTVMSRLARGKQLLRDRLTADSKKTGQN